MKKVFFVSLLAMFFIGTVNADTVSAKVAATSYVSSAVATRVSAAGVQSSGPAANNGGVITDVSVAQYNDDVLDKRINVTRTYVKIPTGANPATGTPTGATYIWLE